MQISRRNIVVCILLSLITCGIYGIYWFYCITEEVGQISGDSSLSGGKAILFLIITCGIYGFFWAYKMGNALSDAKRQRGEHSDDKGFLFLILYIFGLSIVDYCLIQDELNNWAIN